MKIYCYSCENLMKIRLNCKKIRLKSFLVDLESYNPRIRITNAPFQVDDFGQ